MSTDTFPLFGLFLYYDVIGKDLIQKVSSWTKLMPTLTWIIILVMIEIRGAKYIHSSSSKNFFKMHSSSRSYLGKVHGSIEISVFSHNL